MNNEFETILGNFVGKDAHRFSDLLIALSKFSQQLSYFKESETSHKYIWTEDAGGIGFGSLEFSFTVNRGSCYTHCFNSYARLDDDYSLHVRAQSDATSRYLWMVRGWDGINDRLCSFDIDWNIFKSVRQALQCESVNLSLFAETLTVMLISFPLFHIDNKQMHPMPLFFM